MDTGIQVLNSYAACSWALWAVIGLGVLMAGAFSWAVVKGEAFGVLVAVLCVALITGICVVSPLLYAAHECLVADDVSYVSVMENYDVIEQRGEIWVLREKPIDEEGK